MATLDELLDREELLDLELEMLERLDDIDALEERLELEMLEDRDELDDREDDLDELVTPPKCVANFEVALIPLLLLIRVCPQLLKDEGFQLLTISSWVQQLPLPDQLQPM